jgi:hypothetical protein
MINLDSEFDEKNNRNGGSYWTCLVTDDMKRSIYIDSYGENAPN